MGRMGPRIERSAGQRTFLLLMLIAVVLFGVHFESDCNGFKFVSFCRFKERGVCIFLLSDYTTRHLTVVMYICRPIGLQYSIASLVKRPFSDTVEQDVRQKPRDGQD